MNLRKDNEEVWNKLDNLIEKKIGKQHALIPSKTISKDAASSAVNSKKSRKKVMEKLFAELSVKSPVLYNILMSNILKLNAEDKNPKDKDVTEAEEDAVETAKPAEDSSDSAQSESETSDTVSETADSTETTVDTSGDKLPQSEDDKPILSDDNAEVQNIPLEVDAATETTVAPSSVPIQPTSVYGQANTEETKDQMIAIEQELNAASQILEQIQQIAHEQGILSEEEIQNIIIPLRQETESLLNNLQSRERPKEYPGPQRHEATAARSLENPATTWVERNTDSGDINKERGWHGDPSGHAEAARDRWEQEGVSPGGNREAKPSVASAVGSAVSDTARRAAQKAGRVISGTIGSTVANVALDALGTVAGIVAWRYLSGKSVNPKSLIALSVASTKRGIRHIMSTKRGKQIRMALKNKELREQLRNAARDAGAVAAITGGVTAAGTGVARAIESSKKPKQGKKDKK